WARGRRYGPGRLNARTGLTLDDGRALQFALESSGLLSAWIAARARPRRIDCNIYPDGPSLPTLGLCPPALWTELRSCAELVSAVWAELRHGFGIPGLT